MIMAAAGVWNSLFNGSAAVIVFFLVSGFCIHFPFRNNKLDLFMPSFYARRFIRILIPAFIYLTLLRHVTGIAYRPNETVLWSVVCESTYYFLYPAILFLRRRSSWQALEAVSFIAAAIVILTHQEMLPWGDNAYIALKDLTWIVGLPCWILGCWLAETHSKFPLLSTTRIWMFRISIWALVVAENLYHFHGKGLFSSGCILLDLFCFIACAWLGCEIVYASHHGSNSKLEWAGTWSYSLYLIHTITPALFGVVGLGFMDKLWPTHFVVLATAFLLSYGYYRLVEYPSHMTAITAGRWFEKMKNPPEALHSEAG
jgi:peptidoglycan/LPS O-acetylase OafA/YrhL